jgi:hypothetical protein
MRMVRVAAVVSVALACGGVVSAQPKATAGGGMEQRKPSTYPAKESAPIPGLQGFSVVLVLGDLQGGQTADNIPQAARKALADMKDFLPYKSYRLLDSAWILGSHNLAARMRGADDQEYSLNLTAGPSRDDPKPLYLTFQLRDSETPRPSKVGTENEQSRAIDQIRQLELVSERGRIEQQLQALQEKNAPNHPDVIKMRARLADLNQEIAGSTMKTALAKITAACCIISTGFTMDVGETVVVGTSRLRGGDKALIALLTAVPRSK